MSNIHRDSDELDDEEMWLGGKPPAHPPRWLTDGLDTPDPNPYHGKEIRHED